MSIVAFKKKSMIQYGGQRSGKPPGGLWMMRGPFGQNNTVADYGDEGFSINGSHRSKGYVGKDCKFSSSGTPFKGAYARGHGGQGGSYPVIEPLLNANPVKVEIEGNQYKHIKPSVLSTRGMLATKYRWIHSGVYPNYWVQPLYTGNQTDTNSQSVYIQTKAASNTCVSDINNPTKYDGYIVDRGPTLCKTTTAGFTFNQMVSNAPYTKNLKMALTSSEQTQRIQRKCANPTDAQKPFPYAVQTGKGIGAAGTTVRSGGNGCGTTPVLRIHF